MKVSAKLFSYALLLILASLVSISFARWSIRDKQLIQFMSGFTNMKQIVHTYDLEYGPLPQKYDHLDRVTTKWWDQMHFKIVNFGAEIDPAYGSASPVFLLVGGLYPLTEPDAKNPLWIEMAQRVNGVFFIMEHRYFGKSVLNEPTTESFVRYLNSEQALYDIAYFIGVWKQCYYKGNWVVVGEGHGGMLAARFRMKFPNLADAAVAVNSALIPKIEFNEFFESVSLQLSKIDNVLDTIKAAYNVIDEDIVNKRLDLLKDKLRLCDHPADPDADVEKKNVQYMLWSITWNLGLITILKDTKKVLYETKIKEIFNDPSETDPVKKLSNALEVILSRNELDCVHVKYQEAVEYLKNPDKKLDEKFITLTTGLGNRQQFWNSCTEFGCMKTSTKENMFGDVPLDFFLGLCTDTFGEWLNKDILEKSIKKTHMYYDVTNIDVSRILFITHVDVPEKNLAITESNGNPNIKIISIPDIPNTPDELTNVSRLSLRHLYNEIYEYIRMFTGITKLDQPRIKSLRVQDVDDRIQTDTQLIQFMASFSHVEKYIEEAEVTYRNFRQRFNHLDCTYSGKWNQDMFMNDEFYAIGGPVFLLVGSLNYLIETDIQDPLWTEIVQRNKGVLIGLEHRCHGDSLPMTKSDQKLNLLLCNSEQALYDIVNFIGSLQKYFPKSKWIVVGEGHGGKLAAWSRLKFPNLIDGAIAKNAPLVPKKDFSEYFESVSQELKKNGVMDTISEAYENIDDDVTSNRLDQLKEKLNLCDYPNNLSIEKQKKNIQYMLWSITWTLGIITKLKDTETKKYKTNVLEALNNNSETDPVRRLSDALLIILKRYELNCIDVDYGKLVNSLSITNQDLNPIIETGFGSREEFWQSCTEFGYMKTSTKENMFGDVKLDFFIGLCMDVFGEWYNENILDSSIKATERFYNGKNFETTNILFFNHDDYSQKLFALTENNNHQHYDIFNIKDVPDNPNDLTEKEREDLRKKYNEIFECIRVLTEVKELVPPNVYTARTLPTQQEAEENEQIQDYSDTESDSEDDDETYSTAGSSKYSEGNDGNDESSSNQ